MWNIKLLEDIILVKSISTIYKKINNRTKNIDVIEQNTEILFIFHIE